jgi:hypothetical protein
VKRLFELLLLAVASFVLVPNISFAAGKNGKQAQVRKVPPQALQQHKHGKDEELN